MPVISTLIPQCRDCGLEFKFMVGDLCGVCADNVDTAERPQCRGCGKCFKRKFDYGYCPPCDAKLDRNVFDAIDRGLEAPPNPRTAGAQRFHVPLGTGIRPNPDATEDDFVQANLVTSALATAHWQAKKQSTIRGEGHAQRPKVVPLHDVRPLSGGPPNPQRRTGVRDITIKLTKTVLDAVAALPGDAYIFKEPGNKLWRDVESSMRETVVNSVLTAFRKRIPLDAIRITFPKQVAPNTLPDDVTVYNFFKAHSDNRDFVKVSDRDAFKLEVMAVIDPLRIGDLQLLTVKDLKRGKRRASVTDFDEAVTSTAPPAIPKLFLTALPSVVTRLHPPKRPRLDFDEYKVIEWAALVDDDNHVYMKVVSKPLVIRVYRTILAEGRTKQMRLLERVDEGSTRYAAKSYYRLAEEEPGIEIPEISLNENASAVSDELIRVRYAQRYLALFNDLVVKNTRIPAISMHYADATMFQVINEGDVEDAPTAERMSWLVDRMLPNTDIVKFSSNVSAGANTDEIGMLCDAFAHFLCTCTELHSVVVDIQGIHSYHVHAGVRVPEFVLIDPMLHTYDCSAGLGDAGRDGIIRFIEQHRCNEYCKVLRLPELRELDVPECPEDSDDSDGTGSSASADGTGFVKEGFDDQ